jgi:hypothetical protein
MNLILRKQPLLALVLLALAVVSLLVLGAVAHMDLWHLLGFFHKFAYMNPHLFVWMGGG